MSMATMRAAAADALRLRSWALALVAGADPVPPPAVGRDAWRVFLGVERCAHPLRDALGADLLEALPEPARGALERRGVAEAVNALSLRHEAAQLAGLLRARGWAGMVLKGGAAVLGRACEVDVRDLDLLVRPEHAQSLAADMDAAGYTHEGPDFDPAASNRHELAPRTRDGQILVELHFALAPRLEGDPWTGAVPLEVPGLFRMAPANHLWHVLLHGTLHHPERRGGLRDVLVAAAAVRWCAAGDLAEVERRCRAHPRGSLPARMLAMARCVVEGASADPFRRQAAAAYLLYQFNGRYHPSEALLLPLARTIFALGEGAGEYARLWYGSHVSAISRGYAGGSRLDRAVPFAPALGRAAWRSAHLAAALAPAAWLATTARRLAHDAESPPGGAGSGHG
jgi:Uncharacterised nucleotidyltransferase